MAAERERSDGHLHALIENASDLILILDQHATIRYASPSVERILGYSAEHMSGREVTGFLHPDDVLTWNANIALLATTDVSRPPTDRRWRHVDGSYHVLASTVTNLLSTMSVAGLVVNARDVTERNQAEEQVRALNAQLEMRVIERTCALEATVHDLEAQLGERAIDKMKDEFISVVSHEIRTPLTSIRGSLGLLASGLLASAPDRAQRMLDIASNNADRLIRLVNDILDIERMQSGQVALEKTEVNPDDVLQQAFSAMRAGADAAGVRLNKQVSPNLPNVSMDADRIVQTLTHLIGNAIKFAASATTITLSAECVGLKLLVRVADEGRGIPTDKLALIFERFQQVDGSDAREKGGTGLGLAICRSIIQQHGGAIWVESEVGQGSTFLFTIPLQTVPSVDALAPAQSIVLICDDEPMMVRTSARVLHAAGFRIVTAGSGHEALRQALTHSPAVILLDLIMPGMNGHQTLVALRAQAETRLTPVVIMSGLPPGNAGLSRAEVSDWLIKPVDPGELRTKVAQLIGRSNSSPRVLLAEHDAELAEVLAMGLREHGVEVLHARTGRQAIDLCGVTTPDLLFVDIDIPEDDAFSVIAALRARAGSSDLPTIVYTGREIDELQRARLRLGPTEFLTRIFADAAAVERTVLELLHLPPPRIPNLAA